MWEYMGDKVDEVPAGYVGFVYEIEFANGAKYIGKKLALTNQRLKPLKGMRKNALRRKWINTNWKKYSGSSEIVKEMGIEPMFKTILIWCRTKKEMAYWENYYLYNKQVLLLSLIHI